MGRDEQGPVYECPPVNKKLYSINISAGVLVDEGEEIHVTASVQIVIPYKYKNAALVYEYLKSDNLTITDLRKLLTLRKTMKKKQKTKSPKLKRYYLKPMHIKKVFKGWRLTCAGEKATIDSFTDEGRNTKRDFIQWIVKYHIIPNGGGTLRIMLRNGKFQEERTYPKSRDPKKSKG